jgi:hypothetical protein
VIGLLYEVTTSTTGTELARVDFSNPVAGTWNSATFEIPVAIDADTLYVAAIWTPDRYVATSSFFTADLVNGDLTAIQDATNPTGLPGNVRNGKFHVGSTPAFPEDFSNSSCYFADVLFSTGFTAALGTATETDSAITLARTKIRGLGTAAETDSAVALARIKRFALGVASETDSAVAFGRIEQGALGAATETDSAITLARIKIRALGTATETELAIGLGGAAQPKASGPYVATSTRLGRLVTSTPRGRA